MTKYRVICDGLVRGEYATLKDAQLAAYIGGKNFRGIAPRIFQGLKEYPIPKQMWVTAGNNPERLMVTR